MNNLTASCPGVRRRFALVRSEGLWRQAWLFILTVTLSLAIVGGLIVMAGGPPTAVAHFMYAPIVLAAFRFGPWAALATGLVAGAVAGPVAAWIALGPESFTTGQIAEWVIRDAWFAGVGAVLGAAFAYARRQARSLDTHLHTDQSTALPNLKAARRHIDFMHRALGEDYDVLVNALRVLNYQELVSTLGHEQVDAVMRTLGQRLRRLLPRGTFVSRTGPDTFTMIDWVGRDETLEQYVERLQGIDQGAVRAGDLAVYVDTALGVVRTGAADADPRTMFAQAEVAAARVGEGGTAYRIYDPDEDRRRKGSLRLLGEIESAIAEDELWLAYQPKLHLASRRFHGLEALVRWQHPDRGTVSPGEFIPLVEQTQAIDAFTRWVLRQAVGQIASWHAAGYTPSVAVNISTRNLTSDSLLRHIHDLLDRYQVAATSLELEITESALMHVSASRLDLLRELQREGVRIAVDDFGTGYASLAYLRDLPIDILKLDRSFIRAAPSKRPDLMMLKRIIQMAKDLGLEVVGEGVEDAAMLHALSDLGCDQAQGFYIARPMPPERVGALLAGGWDSESEYARG